MLTRTARIGILFSLPAILFFLVFLLLPVASTFILSFMEWKGFILSDIKVAGFSNFIEMFSDGIFFKALLNTLIFVALTTILLNLFGFIGASIIDTGSRATG